MNKATFKYKKDDGTIQDRILLRPAMLKEATNSLKDYNNPNVNYINGFELNTAGLTPTEINKYEKLVQEYFQLPTLEQYIVNNGLDPKRVQQKSFKKSGISNLVIV